MSARRSEPSDKSSRKSTSAVGCGHDRARSRTTWSILGSLANFFVAKVATSSSGVSRLLVHKIGT